MSRLLMLSLLPIPVVYVTLDNGSSGRILCVSKDRWSIGVEMRGVWFALWIFSQQDDQAPLDRLLSL